MQVIVCVREALDWNLSTKQFRIDPKTFEPVVAHARYRIDQFDEIAVETALHYRESPDITVRALCVGTADSEDTLKHALAMQADTATLVETTARVSTTAQAVQLLAAAIQREADVGMVLCGRMSSDYGTGQTGPMLAEALGRPFIGNLIRVEGEACNWRCTHETPTGHEVLHVTAPFVATVTNAPHNIPRVPTMKHVMQAHRKVIDIVAAASLQAEASTGMSVVRRHVPVNLKGCRFLQGTPEEQARELAAWLRAEAPCLQAKS